MIKFIAICPKCEKFYEMPGLQPDWFCPHITRMDRILDINEGKTIEEYPEDKGEKILCKIVEIK